MAKAVGSEVGGENERLVTGCQNCPAANWIHAESAWLCALGSGIYLPLNGEENPADAVPAKCPLWNGGVTIRLCQLK